MSPLSCGYAVLVFVAMQSFVPGVAQDRPLEKVMTILTDLKQEVTDESTAAATEYSTFATFCRDTTIEFSNHVGDSQSEIEDVAATIEEKNETWTTTLALIAKKTKQKLEAETSLEETTAKCLKDKEVYEKDIAEYERASEGIQKATEKLNDATSFIEVRRSVKHVLEMSHKLVSETSRSAALVKQLHAQPGAYSFQSNHILEVLDGLKSEVDEKKTALEDELSKSEQACSGKKTALTTEIGECADTISTKEVEAGELAGEVSSARNDLVGYQKLMTEDRDYLQSVTSQCEARAKDWDQRSQMRAGELDALTKVIQVLTDEVQPVDSQVNVRALLQDADAMQLHANDRGSSVAKGEMSEQVQKVSSNPIEDEMKKPPAPVSPVASSGLKTMQSTIAGIDQWMDKWRRPSDSRMSVASFLQEASVKDIKTHVQQKIKVSALQLQRQEQASQMLQKESRRLRSLTLATMVAHMQADPFEAVKAKITGLIDRLLKEARDESEKRSFCQSQMGQKEKVKRERGYRWDEALKLAAEYNTLEAREATLGLEIEALTEEIAGLKDEMEKAEEARETEKSTNIATIDKGKKGLAGVKEATVIMKEFYSKASRAKARYDNGGKAPVALVQSVPVRTYEDIPEAASSGYGGRQIKADGILAFLETIATDFERTLKATAAAESEAASAYAKYVQTSSGLLAKKEKAKVVKTEYKTETSTKMESVKKDHKTTMDLVDNLNRVMTQLEPICATTQMEYSERVQARQDEITALKEAMCTYLDPQSTEVMCTSR